MHKDNLPIKVDPFRFAENGTKLDGALPLNKMSRLCAGLSEQTGEVAVKLAFRVDEQDIRVVHGHYATHLTLQCQRCMEPFECEIIGDFDLGLVHSEEEATRLPEQYDAVIVEDTALILSEMVEDELIVSLPIVPMHDLKDCKAKLSTELESQFASDTKKESPFKVIETLRTKRKES